MKTKLLLLIIALTASYYQLNAQWTKGKNNAYLKLSAWNLSYNQYYSNSGAIEQNTKKSYFNFSIYGEYGIANKVDVITNIPFFVRNQQVVNTTQNETLNSIGDIDIGIRYAIFKMNHWALSTTLKLGLPTGKNNEGSNGNFQTGDGEFNQLFSTEIGYSSSLNEAPFYSKAHFGFNNRTNNFSNEFRAGLEFGILIFNSKFWVISRLNNVSSLDTNNFNPPSTQGNIFGNNVSYLSYGFEGAYKFSEKMGVSIGIDSAFSGKNIAAAASINGGLFLEL